MILSTLVTSQLHFEMCAGLYGHLVFGRTGVGRWGQGPLDFENFCKKRLFS